MYQHRRSNGIDRSFRHLWKAKNSLKKIKLIFCGYLKKNKLDFGLSGLMPLTQKTT
jgi:hypothetical protein